MGPRRHHTWSGLQEAPELLRARRVPELAQRLGLDLPDPLAGDREVLPDFLQRVLATVGEAEPEPQHLLLARREVRMSLLIVSIMCTGMRIVRAWSAMARVIAWRIHQVA